jgi:hypothetical protein
VGYIYFLKGLFLTSEEIGTADTGAVLVTGIGGCLYL